MTIAINLTHLFTLSVNDFFHNHFVKIASSEPEHQFIFITASIVHTEQYPLTANNCMYVISGPKANTPLMWKIWLNYTLPGICRKHKADLLINTTGVCSLRTRVPQCVIISNLSFIQFPHFFSKKEARFLKKQMPAFLHKAITIVTTSDYLSKEILRQYLMGEEKIKSFHLAASDHYQPVGWEEKESIKDKYAEGKEYFLFSGEIHPGIRLLNLLKAFSFFKKRQKSNMQLIITTQSASENNQFIENLKTFKYREEVQFLQNLPERDLGKITSAAYAFVYPASYDGIAVSPLQAMQCGVPVITTNTGAIPEITGEAAIYADPENFEDIAHQMMLVFKDENKRKQLINAGNLLVQKKIARKNDFQWWKPTLTSIE